jgi:hypothetical protein
LHWLCIAVSIIRTYSGPLAAGTQRPLPPPIASRPRSAVLVPYIDICLSTQLTRPHRSGGTTQAFNLLSFVFENNIIETAVAGSSLFRYETNHFMRQRRLYAPVSGSLFDNLHNITPSTQPRTRTHSRFIPSPTARNGRHRCVGAVRTNKRLRRGISNAGPDFVSTI